MAGAPSRGGSNATTIGLVVSVVVALILAGVLIWLYTMQEELRQSAESANAQKNRIPSGPSGGTLASSVIDGSKTLIGQLTGDNTMTADAAVAAMESAIAEVRDAGKVPDPSAYTNSSGAVNTV